MSQPIIITKWTHSQIVVDWPGGDERSVVLRHREKGVIAELVSYAPVTFDIHMNGEFAADVNDEAAELVELDVAEVVMWGRSRDGEAFLPKGSFLFGFSRGHQQGWVVDEDVVLTGVESNFRCRGFLISPYQPLWKSGAFEMNERGIDVTNAHPQVAGLNRVGGEWGLVGQLEETQPAFAVCQSSR